ncbi:hypothetical protein I317_00488 [Kwoniella heveanensis CBS 569]|nr:hypothetical protein I317_00488 [Kwoniella heveanensis CBS 569]
MSSYRDHYYSTRLATSDTGYPGTTLNTANAWSSAPPPAVYTAYTCRHTCTFTLDGQPCYEHRECGPDSYGLVSSPVPHEPLTPLAPGTRWATHLGRELHDPRWSSTPSAPPSPFSSRSGPTPEQLLEKESVASPTTQQTYNRQHASPAEDHPSRDQIHSARSPSARRPSASGTQECSAPTGRRGYRASNIASRTTPANRESYRPPAVEDATEGGDGWEEPSTTQGFHRGPERARGTSRCLRIATGDDKTVTITYPSELTGERDRRQTLKWRNTDWGTREGFTDGLMQNLDQVEETVEAYTQRKFKALDAEETVRVLDEVQDQLEGFYSAKFVGGRYVGKERGRHRS